MAHSILFSLIGPDRPGLVELVASCVAEHGGSWEESELTRLGGQFAGIVRVVLPSERVEALQGALERLPDLRVISVAPPDDDGGPPRRHLRLDLVGADRPGIVLQISRSLSALGVNFDRLVTTTERAPMSGEPMFRVFADLHAPSNVSDDGVRAALERLTDELIVEIRLTSPETRAG